MKFSKQYFLYSPQAVLNLVPLQIEPNRLRAPQQFQALAQDPKATRPNPDLPMNNPESNKITTLGNPVKEENNRAQAPANTVIPQSNPSLSGVIKNIYSRNIYYFD